MFIVFVAYNFSSTSSGIFTSFKANCLYTVCRSVGRSVGRTAGRTDGQMDGALKIPRTLLHKHAWSVCNCVPSTFSRNSSGLHYYRELSTSSNPLSLRDIASYQLHRIHYPYGISRVINFIEVHRSVSQAHSFILILILSFSDVIISDYPGLQDAEKWEDFIDLEFLLNKDYGLFHKITGLFKRLPRLLRLWRDHGIIFGINVRLLLLCTRLFKVVLPQGHTTVEPPPPIYCKAQPKWI